MNYPPSEVAHLRQESVTNWLLRLKDDVARHNKSNLCSHVGRTRKDERTSDPGRPLAHPLSPEVSLLPLICDDGVNACAVVLHTQREVSPVCEVDF